MSFTSDLKTELTKLVPESKCCQLAEITGFMRFAGSITLRGGLGIKLSTDNPAVARKFISLVKAYFGSKTALSLGEPASPAKSKIYVLDITPDMNAEQILRETGMLSVKEGSNYITDGIAQSVIKKRCCKKAALRGIFMAAGSVSDPLKAYHMEISCGSSYMAKDVSKLLASFGLKSGISERRGKFIVYIKDGDEILDFLGVLGANGQYFEYQEVRITKGMRNRTNRAQNCMNANLDKTVGAAQKQLEAIEKIENSLWGLGILGDKLQQTAVLRKENPELSLAELAELFDPPIKKSGLNHRRAKIVEIAENLGKEGK